MKQAVKEADRTTRIAHPYGKQQAAELSAEEREQLILDHLPQVRLIARRIHELTQFERLSYHV